MASGARVEGLAQVDRSLSRLAEQSSDLGGAWDPIGGRLDEAASALAPRNTGALADSIEARSDGHGVHLEAGSGAVEYAVVQNYGGYNNITPHLFMQRALEAQTPEALRVISAELNTLARRLGLT